MKTNLLLVAGIFSPICLCSCGKDAGPLGSLDLNTVNVNIATAKSVIKLHKANIYPAGSRISINRYVTEKSGMYVSSENVYTYTTTPVDTTINDSFITDLNLCYKWKVLSLANDSLAGGTTPVKLLHDNISFDINY